MLRDSTYKKIKNRFRMNHNLQPSCSYCLPLLWKAEPPQMCLA
jgi:hypothetical protein